MQKIFLDVISLRNMKTAENNVFTAFARMYSKTANVRQSSVLPQSIADYELTSENTGNYTFDVVLNLLPHQIFLMPLTYLNYIKNENDLIQAGIIQFTHDSLT
jgi:hypothetical protein